MSNTSVRLHDLDEWVRSEAKNRGVAKAQVIRDAVRAVAENEGEYADDAGDGDLRERVAELEQRLDRLEAGRSEPHRAGTEPPTEQDRAGTEPVGGGGREPERAGSGSEPNRRDKIAESLLAADWGEVMYSPTDQRVEAAAAAFAELARRERAQTATLVEIAESEGVDVSSPNRLLSDLGGVLDSVSAPTRGSNRYEWRGE